MKQKCSKCHADMSNLTIRTTARKDIKATMRKIPFWFCEKCERFERDVQSIEKGWCPFCEGRTVKINVEAFACGKCERIIKPKEQNTIQNTIYEI